MAEDTKELLLEKAACLFLKCGYHGTSMKKLAEVTGIQAPGIYYYFKSKEEILSHLHEAAAQRFRENVIHKVNKIHDPEEKTKVLIRKVIHLLVNSGDIPPLMLQEFLPKKTNKVRKKTAREFVYFVRDILEEVAKRKGIQKPIDLTVATFYLIAMTSWTYKWYNPEGRITTEKLISHLIRLFFHGFYAGEATLRGGSDSFSGLLLHTSGDSHLPRNKKDLLMKKAAQLFLEYGYHATSMKKLAGVTGMQTPAIYYYFKDKEEILSHLQETGAQRFRENIINEMNKVDDLEEKVKILISKVITLLINFGEIPLLMVQDFSLQKHDKVREKRAKEFVGFIRNTLQELAESKGIQKSIDPTVATFCLIGITSWIYKWYDPKGRLSVQMLTQDMIRLFFQGFYMEEATLGAIIETKAIRKGRPIMDGIMMLPPLIATPQLLAGRCSRCGRTFFPKKEICPDCFDTGTIEKFAFSGRGKLATFTIVRRSLGAKKVPYALGYINTPEQIQLLAPLTDCDFDELRIGMEMEVVFEEELGDEGTPLLVYKYRPLLDQ